MDIFPAILFCLWIYGFILGMAMGNPIDGIIRNFAGMILFLCYYIFIGLRIPRQGVAKMLLLSALTVSIYYLVRLVSGMDETGRNVFYLTENFGQERLSYNAGIVVVFPLLSLMIYSFVTPMEKRNKIFDSFLWLKRIGQVGRLIILVMLLIIVILNYSKGYFLSLIFLLVFLPLLSFHLIVKNRYGRKKIWINIVILLFIFFMGFKLGLGEIIGNIFSAKEVSNYTRYEQITELINDLTFFGKGLGATLSSGYMRDSLGYGFEVSYINIFHKFGIFAIILLIVYFAIFKKLSINIYRGKNVLNSVIAFGGMCYLFPALGNPTLLGTVSNVLFSSSLYLLRDSSD